MGGIARRAGIAVAAVVLVTAGCSDGNVEPPVPTDGDLTASEFVQPTGPWEDGTYRISSLDQKVTGIGAMIAGCGSEATRPLELRLDRRFETMTVSVAQGRRTKTTAKTLAVAVEDNYHRPIGSFQVQYGQVPPPSSITVRDVAVIDIKAWVLPDDSSGDPDGSCTPDTQVEAVLSSLSLVPAS